MIAEQQIGSKPIYRAQPTVRVNDAEVAMARDLLLGMDMHEQQGGFSRMELRFTNILAVDDSTVRLAFDDRTFEFGKRLTVYSGDETNPSEIFRGFITGMENHFPEHSAPEFVVLAEDELQRSRLHRQTRFHDTSDLNNLTGAIADIAEVQNKSDSSIQPGTQMQLNESDLAFLRRVTGKHDVDFQASGGELQCGVQQNIRRAEVGLRMHSQLRSARVIADLAHQTTGVTVSGWDHTQGKKIKAEGKGLNLGPGSGLSGREIYQRVFGERKEHLSHLALSDSAEATAAANSAFDQRARSFVTLHGEAEGNPLLRVGTHVAVEGLGKLFDNTYYIISAHHHFTLETGYKTDFTAECAYLGVI
jgi:uncharacterized protein